ncbi:MAG: hypothetical protein ISN26_08060 [Betaproteobacteria bacterium AqS2]|uniref:Uncharacterized protein n=1 Tax=Candidatus Amphirhobacter heronislandensis TaxID=1732024 RepID=A0A930XXE2_9GAMM|nr:hypothetical protein [Betaproteobacteria bacterium AqS2]
MAISFASLGDPRNLQRHRIRFDTEADFKKALRINEEQGFVLFRNGGGNLIGQIVLVSPDKLIVEIDAAAQETRDQP